MKLVYAITLSMVLHFAVLYVPLLQTLFQVMPLELDEWKAVLWISAPVHVCHPQFPLTCSFIDEILKLIERLAISPPRQVKSKSKKE